MYLCKGEQRERARSGAHSPHSLTPEEFATRLAQLDTPREVAGRGLELARELLHCDASLHLVRQGDHVTLGHLGGHVPPGVREALTAARARPEVGLGTRALTQGVTTWSNDYAQEPGALGEWVAHGLKSYVAVPVRHSQEMVGVVAALNFGH